MSRRPAGEARPRVLIVVKTAREAYELQPLLREDCLAAAPGYTMCGSRFDTLQLLHVPAGSRERQWFFECVLTRLTPQALKHVKELP